MAKKDKEEKTGVDKLIEELEKKFGLSRKTPEDAIIVSTGSLHLNEMTGVGGTVLGKMIEISGENSCGKSTTSLHQMAEYQKAFPDKKVAYFDYEHSFDASYAQAIGVDMDNLLIYQPDYQEMGYDMILGLIEKEVVSCIVIDSQTAAAPKAIVDGEMSDATISLQARVNSKFCLKVKGMLDRHKVTLFVISQLRANIGAMSGEVNITTGGKGFTFYSDMRWKVWKFNDKVNELNKTTIDVIKNKLGKPFGSAKINVLWGVGFDKIGEVIDYAADFKLIEKGGAGWYTIEEQKMQGIDKVKEFMNDNPEYFEKLKEQVLIKIKEKDGI